ncbi:MAG: hypothetical protein WD382_03775 [Halofilum sp. (in: g-proteobacteria)]
MHRINIRAVGGREWPAGEQPADMRREAKAAGCREVRRGNRLSCMALLGALDCTAAGGGRPAADAAVHLASSYGNVADTASLVEALLRDGQPPAPLAFINSSTNMAGFYVARELGLDSPGLMLSRGSHSVLAALELLGGDAAEGQHLIGAVEECAWPLAAHRRRLRLSPDTPLAEGSYWLWLDSACERPVALLHGLRRHPDRAEVERALDETGDASRTVVLGTGITEGELTLPAKVTRQSLTGDCPHARIARLLVEFSTRPRPGHLCLVDREPASTGYLLLHLERTGAPAHAENAA